MQQIEKQPPLHPMEQPRPVKHLGYLDGLRALAALYVVLHHVVLQAVSQAPNGESPAAFLQLFMFGRYAVDLFIVLSGFCLMLPIVRGDGELRGGALRFFQRRAWRILPTYYLALALSCALGVSILSKKTGTLWDASIPITAKGVLTHLFLLQDAIRGEGTTINYVFWSIAVEWKIYFLFPLLVWVWSRFDGIAISLTVVILSYLLFFCLKRFGLEGLTPQYIGLFCLGMLGASIAFPTSQKYHKLSTMPWPWIMALTTLAVILVSTLKLFHGKLMPFYAQDLVVGIWDLCLILTAALNEKIWIHRCLNFGPLVFIGTFAYSIYVIHAPVLQIVWQYGLSPWGNGQNYMLGSNLIIGVPLIIATSYLFFCMCERPFLKRKQKIKNLVWLKEGP